MKEKIGLIEKENTKERVRFVQITKKRIRLQSLENDGDLLNIDTPGQKYKLVGCKGEEYRILISDVQLNISGETIFTAIIQK